MKEQPRGAAKRVLDLVTLESAGDVCAAEGGPDEWSEHKTRKVETPGGRGCGRSRANEKTKNPTPKRSPEIPRRVRISVTTPVTISASDRASSTDPFAIQTNEDDLRL